MAKSDQILAQEVGTKWMTDSDLKSAPDLPAYIERTEAGVQFVFAGEVINFVDDEHIPVVFTDESFGDAEIVVL